MGGLDAYQKASLAGESTQAYAQFSAAEWVLEELGGKPLVATHKSAQRTEPVVLPGGPDRPDTAPLQLLDVEHKIDVVSYNMVRTHPVAQPRA